MCGRLRTVSLSATSTGLPNNSVAVPFAVKSDGRGGSGIAPARSFVRAWPRSTSGFGKHWGSDPGPCRCWPDAPALRGSQTVTMDEELQSHTSQPIVPPKCPVEVPFATMRHRWDTLTFLHWKFDPDRVQALLPQGLTVDTFDGSAWVGLVPFFMDVAPGRGPSVPWLLHFCETNVRTYAKAPDGTRGVWFFSLDAARLAAVLAGRGAYRMPYFWSKMALQREDATVAYDCRRRWPGPKGSQSRVVVRPGARIPDADLRPLDHFLTARYRLYQDLGRGARQGGSRLGAAWAWHEPWELHRAEVLELDDELVAASGLPQPTDDPLVHFSPGVDVRIGPPSRLTPADR